MTSSKQERVPATFLGPGCGCHLSDDLEEHFNDNRKRITLPVPPASRLGLWEQVGVCLPHLVLPQGG